MRISESNTYTIIALIITTIIGPILVWTYTQGKIEKYNNELSEKQIEIERKKNELSSKQLVIDNLKLEVSNKQLELNQIEKTVDLHEKLNSLLDEQRKLYDEYTVLVQNGHSKGSFDLQRKKLQIEEKDQEIQNVKQSISKLTGKEVENIKGNIPPLAPSGFRKIK